jgi:hypothetical protein
MEGGSEDLLFIHQKRSRFHGQTNSYNINKKILLRVTNFTKTYKTDKTKDTSRE